MARILLIDDDRLVRQSIRLALADSGHQLDEAENGADGLDRAAAAPPDLVITDLIMPEREGIETILALRRMAPDLPIIAISGGGRIGPGDLLAAAKRLGATTTLRKPFDDVELLDQIERALDVKVAC
ncbi:response regulator [Desertibaculum subflavum]|uniref:response regulator n=1 Tax=Desertibaculum subflavum TaxID=2268458 RepID=UPI000E6639D8